MNPNMCGFWNDAHAHEYTFVSTRRHTATFSITRSGVRDFECMRDVNYQVVHARDRIGDSLRVRLVTLLE